MMRRTLYATIGARRASPYPRRADAQVLDVYSRLAARDLRPAPLVPTRGAAVARPDRPDDLQPRRRSAPAGTRCGSPRPPDGRGRRPRRRRLPSRLAAALRDASPGEHEREPDARSAASVATCSRAVLAPRLGCSCGRRAAASTRSAAARRGRSRSRSCETPPPASSGSSATTSARPATPTTRRRGSS